MQAYPAVAMDASGKATAVWLDYRSNKKAIMSATLAAGGSAWSTNLKVSTNTSQYKFDPVVAFGPDGTTYAAWTYDPQADFVDAEVHFSKMSPGASAWSAEVKVNDVAIQAAARPSIAVAADGSIMVVWSRAYNETRVSRSLNGGSTWTSSTPVPMPMSSGELAADESGNIFLSGQSGGVRISRWQPGDSSWSTPQMISDIPSATSGSLAATNTRLVVVWRDIRNGSNGEIYGRIGIRN